MLNIESSSRRRCTESRLPQCQEAEASRLQTAVIDSAGGYRTKTRSPALAIYGTDTPGIGVQAEILKRRMRYLTRYMEREDSIKSKG